MSDMMARLFGTNGVRGVVNKDLTADLALRLGKAIGSFFKGDVAIAADTRDSKDMILSAVAAGMMSVGANVINLGVTPSPALQYYVASHNIAGGVIITASHNPPQFNGIKCVGPTGRELIRADEEKIEGFFSKDMKCCQWDSVGTMSSYASATEDHVNAVLKHVDADAVRKAKLTVIMDCANGASFISAPLLLKRLGVKAIILNGDPRGIPERPSEPTEENLGELISLVKSKKADIGIAHDGDADRTAFVSDGGRFVGGDEGLSIIAKYALSKKKGPVVTPVSSSSMVDDVVMKAGGTMIRTAVGTPTVTKVMLDNKAIFGGEEGGMIFPEHQLCRDGAMTAAKMLECIAKEGPLSKQISKLPVYHIIKRKIDCPDDLKDPLLKFLKDANKGAKADMTDGLKLIYADGWVLARPSGTEPKFRVYSESKNKDVALKRSDETVSKAIEFVKRASN